MRERVEAAMDHWHNFTCIKFESYNPLKHSGYFNRLYFKPGNM
jgi:hypothetical protein